MTGDQILARVRFLMNDSLPNLRNADADLLTFLNDGIQYIGGLRPDTLIVSGTVSLAAGTKQNLATMSPAGQRLLDIYRCGGTAIRQVARNELDSSNPTWHADAQATTITQFCYDPRDPTTFWVSPPAVGGTQVEMLYVQALTPLTTATITSTIPLADQYTDALVNYIASRCYLRESEDEQNIQIASGYRKLTDEFLTAKTRADLLFSPDLNNPGGNPTKAAQVGGV
jgi:hypothetical protein